VTFSVKYFHVLVKYFHILVLRAPLNLSAITAFLSEFVLEFCIFSGVLSLDMVSNALSIPSPLFDLTGIIQPCLKKNCITVSLHLWPLLSLSNNIRYLQHQTETQSFIFGIYIFLKIGYVVLFRKLILEISIFKYHRRERHMVCFVINLL